MRASDILSRVFDFFQVKQLGNPTSPRYKAAASTPPREVSEIRRSCRAAWGNHSILRTVTPLPAADRALSSQGNRLQFVADLFSHRRRIAIIFLLLLSECTTGAAHSQTLGYTTIKSTFANKEHDYVYPIKILLPTEILPSISADGQLANSVDGVSYKIILDLGYGEFYRFIKDERGISTLVEGQLNRERSPAQCAALAQRAIIYGTNEPRERDSQPNLEADAPSRQFTFAIGCTNYVIEIQCSEQAEPWACRRALQNLQSIHDWRRILKIADTLRDDRYRGPAKRLPPQATNGALGQLPQKSLFSYLEPGILHGRQYLAPPKCGSVAIAEQFYADMRTEYSRLVFAGPDVLKRFPVDLGANNRAIANSQIFAPGGGFLLNHANADHLLPQGARRNRPNFATTLDTYRDIYKNKMNCKDDNIQFEQDDNGKPRLGIPGERDWYADKSNFLYPWQDTFCEFRGRLGTAYFFCGPKGRLVEGIHFGVDLRGPTQNTQIRTPVIAVADGTIVKVPPICRAGKEKECKADPHSPNFDTGSEVKLRSSYDPRLFFIYRHMNPDWSPFANANGHPILKEGDHVNAGQIVGYMHSYLHGNPLGTSKHLHFEIEYAPPADLLNRCTRKKGDRIVQLCAAREKVPPYPSLLVAYLRERYGYHVDLSQKARLLPGDDSIKFPVLPRLPNEVTVDELRERGYSLRKLNPIESRARF